MDASCKEPIAFYDEEQLLTPDQIQRKTLFEWKKIRDQNKDFIECLTTDCNGMVFRNSDSEKNFKCELCGQKYCINCQIPKHDGKTCEQVQKEKEQAAIEAKANEINNTRLVEDNQLEDWAKQVGAKQCSQCKYWVEKNQGCNHMTCKCSYQFCYVCGGPHNNCACKK